MAEHVSKPGLQRADLRPTRRRFDQAARNQRLPFHVLPHFWLPAPSLLPGQNAADRRAPLEPLRQGVQVFGRVAKDVARGLRIRCDWGAQYIADVWINEVKWLG
jgi:hypothetical protein